MNLTKLNPDKFMEVFGRYNEILLVPYDIATMPNIYDDEGNETGKCWDMNHPLLFHWNRMQEAVESIDGRKDYLTYQAYSRRIDSLIEFARKHEAYLSVRDLLRKTDTELLIGLPLLHTFATIEMKVSGIISFKRVIKYLPLRSVKYHI